MFTPIIDIFRYLKMFQNYLGRRIYIIFFLSLLAALSEGFGIVMLFPLFETLDGLAIAPSEGINKYLFDFLNYFGLADSVSKIILVITIAFLMKGLVTFFSMGFNAFLIGQLLKELKGSLFDRYTLMSYGYYTSKDTGHFTNLINEQPTKAIEAFKQLTLCVGQIVNTIVLMVLAFFMTLAFGLMALLVGFLLLLIFSVLNSYVRELSRISARENGVLTRWLIQMLQGYKYLNATGQSMLLKINIMDSVGRLVSAQVKAGIASAFTSSVREPIAVVFIMAVVLIQLLVLEQKIEPILVSIVLFYRAFNAVMAVQGGFQNTFLNIGSMELVNQEFINQKKHQDSDGEINAPPLSESIRFNNVSFRYTSQNENVLDKMSIVFPVKESIAIVGESGAGKSTLADLIALLHQPQHGEVLIDGVSGHQIHKSSWRSQIGYVSQETVIFDDTIANNICMWKGDYTNDKDLMGEIKDAAKRANILDFIKTLPNGFESLVGEHGVLLSGGQRQRLFIARELFRKPSLLILDEATSALDSSSEKKIQQSIESLKGTITVIIIAHRLSTIRNVDLIYLLQNGQIIESGTFDALMEDNTSHFKKLATMQSLENI